MTGFKHSVRCEVLGVRQFYDSRDRAAEVAEKHRQECEPECFPIAELAPVET